MRAGTRARELSLCVPAAVLGPSPGCIIRTRLFHEKGGGKKNREGEIEEGLVPDEQGRYRGRWLLLRSECSPNCGAARCPWKFASRPTRWRTSTPRPRSTLSSRAAHTFPSGEASHRHHLPFFGAFFFFFFSLCPFPIPHSQFPIPHFPSPIPHPQPTQRRGCLAHPTGK